MVEHGKRYNEAVQKMEANQVFEPAEAFGKVKAVASAKFNETVDVAIRLGVDPRHGDQMVRGTTTIPHGTGKVRRVAVFAKGEKAQEATEIVKGWREQGELPFPNFPPEKIAEMDNKLEYPSVDSAVRKGREAEQQLTAGR